MQKLSDTAQQAYKLYQTAREAIWRYGLDELEGQAIDALVRTIEATSKQLAAELAGGTTPFRAGRVADIIKELDGVTVGLREVITNEISESAHSVFGESIRWHQETFSIGGLANINSVTASAGQLRAIASAMYDGQTLADWVFAGYERAVADQLAAELGAGMLQGASYQRLGGLLESKFADFAADEITTLMRSYIQGANVAAHELVMEANADLLRGWEWSSLLESSNMSTGTGTCLRCAVLDGQIFPIGEGPPIPLHPNCRCYPVAVVKSFKEMGIQLPTKEIPPVARQWADFADKAVGRGRGGRAVDWGTFRGSYGEWFDTRPDVFKAKVLGPKRFELYKSGAVDFSDFVDAQTGRQKLIGELTQ